MAGRPLRRCPLPGGSWPVPGGLLAPFAPAAPPGAAATAAPGHGTGGLRARVGSGWARHSAARGAGGAEPAPRRALSRGGRAPPPAPAPPLNPSRAGPPRSTRGGPRGTPGGGRGTRCGTRGGDPRWDAGEPWALDTAGDGPSRPAAHGPGTRAGPPCPHGPPGTPAPAAYGWEPRGWGPGTQGTAGKARVWGRGALPTPTRDRGAVRGPSAGAVHGAGREAPTQDGREPPALGPHWRGAGRARLAAGPTLCPRGVGRGHAWPRQAAAAQAGTGSVFAAASPAQLPASEIPQAGAAGAAGTRGWGSGRRGADSGAAIRSPPRRCPQCPRHGHPWEPRPGCTHQWVPVPTCLWGTWAWGGRRMGSGATGQAPGGQGRGGGSAKVWVEGWIGVGLLSRWMDGQMDGWGEGQVKAGGLVGCRQGR